ncbi:threonine-rich protein-like [Haliotis cracherodii]|uniref:threonine-rich protein-like n=1 Tax=Haliotis cracherodii TaxID=6455 RepID=UPI0039E9EAB0
MNFVCMTSALASLSVVLSLQGPFDKITHMCYGGFYKVKHTHTYISCMNLCWFSKQCKAISWLGKSRDCRLHDTTLTDPSQAMADPRCISTEVHTSQMGPSHPCTGRPCPDTHVCAPVEAASSHVCLPLEGPLDVTTAAATTATSMTTTDLDVTTAAATTATSVTTTALVATTAAATTATSVTTTALDVTTAAATTATSMTTTDLDATTTTTAGPATTSPTAPAIMTVITTSVTTTDASCEHGFVYKGCYLDDRNRMINDIHDKNVSMTHERCLTRCRQGNYVLAGLEYYKHCYCGNSYDNVKYPVMSEGDCNTPCAGNSGQICGGHYRLSLFQCT